MCYTEKIPPVMLQNTKKTYLLEMNETSLKTKYVTDTQIFTINIIETSTKQTFPFERFNTQILLKIMDYLFLDLS